MRGMLESVGEGCNRGAVVVHAFVGQAKIVIRPALGWLHRDCVIVKRKAIFPRSGLEKTSGREGEENQNDDYADPFLPDVQQQESRRYRGAKHREVKIVIGNSGKRLKIE